ncbi:hypothetical protein [Paraburkholderia phenoliruptrix]|uniref:hypothetical protein n=1 Tax=Paraburkholderia phenoliruptrix TaxID=252970 RepID=UPI003D98FD91
MKPPVLAAEVPRRSIGAVLDERNEAESVLMRRPAARAEGTPNEWQKRYEAVAAANRAAMHALVHRLKPSRQCENGLIELNDFAYTAPT